MTANQLRRHLDHWHITPYRFARIAKVRPSTVGRWLDGTSDVPGYAASIVSLLELLSARARQDVLFPTTRRLY